MLEEKAEIISTEYDVFTYARIALEFHFWSGIWQTYRNPCLSATVFMGTTLLHMQGSGREMVAWSTILLYFFWVYFEYEWWKKWRRWKKEKRSRKLIDKSLCTGRTSHRESRGIALFFHDHGTRRGWGVSVTPRPLFTPWKDPVPIVQEARQARGPVRTGAENLVPNGIWFPDRPAPSQSLIREKE
jgi:hypothetical protein